MTDSSTTYAHAQPSTPPPYAPGSAQYTQMPVQMPRRRGGFWRVLLIIFLVCAFCGGLPLVLIAVTSNNSTSETGADGQSYTFVSGNEKSEHKILAVYIDQPIATAAQDYSENIVTTLVNGQYVFGYKVKDDLAKAADDSTISGVLLIINSPGGTVVGARAIADGVEAFRQKTNKPVYAYIQDIGASGAYWAAVSADKVYADQGSLIGSIGVLMGPFEYYDKLVALNGASTEKGIDIMYITGGQYKDLGNPTKKITEEELAILQKGINTEYDGFVSYVSSRRKISANTIKQNVKALVYGVSDAQQYGLIDGAATYDDALKMLTTQAGVQTDFQVVKVSPATGHFLGGLLGSLQQSLTNKSQQTLPAARTCYLCGKQVALFGSPTDY